MWGDESPWLARVASVLAGEASVTLLVYGGEIAWLDAARSIDVGRRLIAVAGSGRTADELAAAARREPSDPRARDLIASGLVDIVSWDDAYALKARLTAVLAERV